jgi:hypothetical protein
MQIKKIFNKTILFFIALISLSSCSTQQEYMLSISNSSGFEIDNAHILYDDFTSVGGVIPPGGIASHLYPDRPIPIKAKVQWRTHNGDMHSKTVEVKKLTKNKGKIEIIFEIDDNNDVSVLVKPWR